MQKELLQKYGKACIDCGKTIYRESTRCRSCALKLQWRDGSNSSRRMRRRGQHPNWKGGRINKQGYIYVLKPNHPRAKKTGYVGEHILNWEMANNKTLPEGWVVHHLNGIKDDNRPKNLVALPSIRHNHILPAKEKRIQVLEARLKKQGILC